MAEIEKAVKDKILIKNTKFYEPNMPKLIDLLLAELCVGKKKEIMTAYKEKLKYFYTDLGVYTRKTYLSFESIKQFTGLDQRKAAELDLKMVIQVPHFLRYLEYKEQSYSVMIIQVMNLEKYMKIIEKLEIQNYHILQEKKLTHEFADSFEWFSKVINKMQKEEKAVFMKNAKAMKTLGD